MINMDKLGVGEIMVKVPATMLNDESEQLGEEIDEELRAGLEAVATRLREKFPQVIFEVTVNGW